MLINSEVVLPGATEAARKEFEGALQDYAEKLARESENQEISNRVPGARYGEVSANSVARAKAVINRFGERAKPKALDIGALAGLPIFSGGAGVIGSYLNSPLQWIVFSVVAFFAVCCVVVLAVRRLL